MVLYTWTNVSNTNCQFSIPCYHQNSLGFIVKHILFQQNIVGKNSIQQVKVPITIYYQVTNTQDMSWISTHETILAKFPKVVQEEYQKEVVLLPSRNTKPSRKTDLAFKIEFQVVEPFFFRTSRALEFPRYLLDKMCTQDLLVLVWISHTNFPSKAVLALRATRTPSPPRDLGRVILSQPTKWTPLPSLPFQINFLVILSSRLQMLWGI